MNEIKKEKLYIPQGLNTNKEFMKGLEFKSLGISLIIILILNIPNILITIFFNKTSFFFIFYLTISGILSIGLVIKDNNLSILDIIGFFIKFINSQKKYEYISKDEWR